MSPRTGRPPKENPKSTRIQIRLDDADIAKLDACVKRDNTSRSDIIRRGIELVYSEGKQR